MRPRWNCALYPRQYDCRQLRAMPRKRRATDCTANVAFCIVQSRDTLRTEATEDVVSSFVKNKDKVFGLVVICSLIVVKSTIAKLREPIAP